MGLRFGAWWLAGLLCSAAFPAGAAAHPGALDAHGGHFSEKTARYHYHRPYFSSLLEKRWHLRWSKKDPRRGELLGVLAQMRRGEAIWLHIENRPAYQDFASRLNAANRNDRKQWVRIWLAGIAPSLSAAAAPPRYAKWLRKKIPFEVSKRLKAQPLRVHFTLSPRAGRAIGMLFQGEASINLWIVRQGWSFYAPSTPPGTHHQRFIQAENTARSKKRGLWKR